MRYAKTLDSVWNKFAMICVVCLTASCVLAAIDASAVAAEKRTEDLKKVILVGIDWDIDPMISVWLVQEIEGEKADRDSNEHQKSWTATWIFLRGFRGYDDTRRVWRILDYFTGKFTEEQDRNFFQQVGTILSKQTPPDRNRRIFVEQGPEFILTQSKDEPVELGHFLEYYPLGADFVKKFNVQNYSYTPIEQAYRHLIGGLRPVTTDTGSTSDSPLVALHVMNDIQAVAKKEKILDTHYITSIVADVTPFLKADAKGRVAVCHRKGGEEGKTLRVDLDDAFDHLDHGDDPGVCPSDVESGRPGPRDGHDDHRDRGRGKRDRQPNWRYEEGGRR